MLHVVEDPDPAMLLADKTGRMEETYKRTADQATLDLLRKVSELFTAAGATVAVRIEHGAPAQAIKAVAEAGPIPVIVTAPGQHQPKEKMLSGSITLQLLHFNYQGMLILARKPKQEEAPSPVVFCLDGSSESLDAVKLLVPLISGKVPILLLSSLVGYDNTANNSSAFFADDRASVPAQPSSSPQLEKILPWLDSIGRSCDSITTDKSFDHWLADYLKENSVNLLVFCRTRDDFLHRPLYGSQAERLFVESPCSTALYCSHSPI